jgi:ankyrin repeat protein/mono/diheme cytochrome c family protein
MEQYRLRVSWAAAGLVAAALWSGVENHAQQPPAKVDFATEIQPLLRQHCISCHGPKEQKNGLRLDRRRDAMRGGTIAVIGRGNADGSRLYHKLIGETFGPQMPPTGPLAPEQIAKIRAWIDQGAEWPDALSGEEPAPPADPAATRVMEALRAGNSVRFSAALDAGAAAIDKKGPGGATPLMYAALYGDVASVRALTERGADVNAADEAGATALMWAVTDLEKTRLLIEKGARVNARSADGRTALLIASGLPGATDVVSLLLDNGASLKDRAPGLFGDTTPLLQAAYMGGEATFTLLVERGADVAGAGVVALGLSMRQRCDSCVGTMMKALDPGAYTVAMLMGGPPLGPALATPMLLDAGADINARDPEGRTALMLAAASEVQPVHVVKTLIDRGADIHARNGSGQTALTYARMRGNTAVTQLLEAAGATDGRPVVRPTLTFVPARSARAAVQRSLPLLQKADQTFLRKSGCVSCHHNNLAAMTVSLARSRGIPVDEHVATQQRAAIGEYVDGWRDRLLQGIGIPGDASTVAYTLLGLAAEKYPADATTDAMARFLKLQQTPGGFWIPLAHRPPLEGDPVHASAISMRALQLYAPATERAEYRAAIDRAAAYITQVRPESTEQHIYRLLGLHWSQPGAAAIQDAARELLAQQRRDGGWAQLPTLESDAYATGQVLVALAESGAVRHTDRRFTRGVEFLRKTQLADGSWHVASRALPIQPHFESGFPFGRDQFISAAATNWAAMALVHASGGGS